VLIAHLFGSAFVVSGQHIWQKNERFVDANEAAKARVRKSEKPSFTEGFLCQFWQISWRFHSLALFAKESE